MCNEIEAKLKGKKQIRENICHKLNRPKKKKNVICLKLKELFAKV